MKMGNLVHVYWDYENASVCKKTCISDVCDAIKQKIDEVLGDNVKITHWKVYCGESEMTKKRKEELESIGLQLIQVSTARKQESVDKRIL
eukprot:CAMPEP_0197070052 /NCGR_PEP_ID=MMETSP1384-20130603/197328_1 /TAXON_ID=29189 /ORGANISM="Ammonia sp." /LENGTH=89 /DNA_ID=CAMNT_0042508301 /DNA_START=5 /DNA_END=270 /DNA_ORIENTATION=-